ncbi:hypothetical protein CLD22_04175 [Rubrivivax gelatinosus]|nr:hypothetical protein [Rubrivivax gelatinosus]
MAVERWRRFLPGLWAGWLLCVALLATPAGFALLPQADAGRLAARMLAQEAYTSLALGVVMLLLERAAVRYGGGSQFSWGFGLTLGAVFCTVLGYFVIQPMMPAARLGQGPLSFGALHGISTTIYALKCALVLTLAWRASFGPRA